MQSLVLRPRPGWSRCARGHVLNFMVGLTGFCLALMVAIFSTLHNFQAGSCNPAYRMLGGVLVWISITASWRACVR